MQDIQSRVKQLKRPGLLVRAALFGVDEYRRSRDLQRLLPGLGSAAHGPVLIALLESERALEDERIAHQMAYSVARHIDLLTAIMAEHRDFEAVQRARALS
ncbi:hypothetical protein SAMN04488003_1254 [Loktanella fryxellensis]|uniref:Uncharacterized protein n=1 Tax=Loktanella fryxellensis TaxID=245187 RepID=A0A1H8ICJ0_9RHOB|nr:DUF6477 family protein [Loktanella fryxellensis]SEN65902.1 hypothetical protein SAMN04488003_1254 [Loktanella fryxellensis]